MSEIINAHDDKLNDIILLAEEVVIAGHTNPDGDCIGACLALGLGFKAIGKKTHVLLDEYAPKYDFIPGKELIFKGDFESLNPDTFIACDCGSKDRLGKVAELFDRTKTTLNLDHHATNDNFANYNLVDSHASSTCELVFNIIAPTIPITSDIGIAISAGILYDTGGLRHKSTTADTLMLISRLHAQDVPLSNIFNSMLFEHSLVEAKMMSKAIDRMILTDDSQIIASYINLADLAEAGATSKDLDYIVEYLSETKGIEVALFIHEISEGNMKVSMRSKRINIGNVAKRLGGGGHQLAAGFNYSGSFEDTLSKTIELIEHERLFNDEFSPSKVTGNRS